MAGFLSGGDGRRGLYVSLNAVETSRVAPKTANALVNAVRTSTIFAMSFLSEGGVMYVPLTIEILGEEKITYRKAAAPRIRIILCLLFKCNSW